MPASIKITKQQILDISIEILREHGIDALNVRAICRNLGCTARPIFRAFGSMEGLKKELLSRVKEIYIQNLYSPYETTRPFLSLGLNYIRFAVEEKNFFTFLFMTGQIDIGSPADLISDQWASLQEEMAETLKISKKDAKTLLLELSILAHGMAALITQNKIKYEICEIEDLFILAFEGIYLVLKSKTKEK